MIQQKTAFDDPIALVTKSLLLLKRQACWIVIASQMIAIIGIVIVVLLPNKYLATTTILVDPQKIPERYVTSTVTSDPSARLNALTQLVLSATKLQEIIDQLNLYPRLRETKSREEVLEFVRSKIKIEVKGGSEQGMSSFTISYEDVDRSIVAPMANQLASSFINWNLRIREQQALSTSQFLSGELEKAKASLEAQENELKSFRVMHAGETPDDLSGNMQAISTLQSQMQANVDAIGRLDEERILLSQIRHPIDPQDLSEVPERMRLSQEHTRLEAEIANMHREYTDRYPDIVSAHQQLALVDKKLSALPASAPGAMLSLDSNTRLRLELVNQQLARRNGQQNEIHRNLASYQGKVGAVPALQMQLADLTRNYDVSKQNYQSLLDKSMSAGMAKDLESAQEAERYTALDTAKTPEKPFTPKRIPLVAGVFTFSLLFPSVLVLAFEFLLGRVESREDIIAMLTATVPIMGTIPPIVSQTQHRHRCLAWLGTGVFSLLSIVAVIILLVKVRPIL